MKFTYRVLPDDGDEYVVVARTRDVVQWEKGKAGRKVSDLLGVDVRMGELYALCHVAAKRQGLYDGTFGEFEASVDLEPVDDDGAVAESSESDPT